MIDEEIRSFVAEGEQTARDILEKYRDDLDRLAKGLLEYETLTGDEIGAVLRGEKIERPDAEPEPVNEPDDKKPPRSTVPSSRRRPGGGMEPEPQT